MRYLLLTVVLTIMHFQFSLVKGDDDMAELIAMLHGTCTAETGISDALIEDARKGNFADDPKLKCYLKCYLAQLGLVDEDSGEIDVEGLLAMAPPNDQARVKTMFDACMGIKGADVCDTSFQTHKCWQSKDPEKYAEAVH